MKPQNENEKQVTDKQFNIPGDPPKEVLIYGLLYRMATHGDAEDIERVLYEIDHMSDRNTVRNYLTTFIDFCSMRVDNIEEET